jgi:MoxR-like ATPase
MSISVQELNARIADETIFINDLLAEINKVIVGQPALIERVLTALLADGHILLEGVPGLAKTLLIKTTAEAIHAHFARIQFTPDLLPADLMGTQVYNPQLGIFAVHRGPIFTNLLLADEINRAPAKVQSAPCWKPCKNAGHYRQQTDRLPDLSWSWRRRTPSSRKAPIRCPKRRSIVSCSSCWSIIPRRPMSV